MKFALVLTDKPDSSELRNATRSAHIEWVDQRLSQVVTGGPLLDREGNVIGSLLVIEAADLKEAEDFAAADPYQKAGLFASTVISEYKALIKDGRRA
ncbi:hypothetical protein J8I87_11885 [Paraburkholderia sp. LEh10]|uniref:YciI family protein n=1 Tax=Paraburkholderia sp. LEh10 TaxID=2821353 RepID=UPI001AE64F7F|nr:YciI family protein [Paraburkholderia sp. LEh10]MBP0590401.1 hypothetical protein [Paraburkholderia sp. LEh10]